MTRESCLKSQSVRLMLCHALSFFFRLTPACVSMSVLQKRHVVLLKALKKENDEWRHIAFIHTFLSLLLCKKKLMWSGMEDDFAGIEQRGKDRKMGRHIVSFCPSVLSPYCYLLPINLEGWQKKGNFCRNECMYVFQPKLHYPYKVK